MRSVVDFADLPVFPPRFADAIRGRAAWPADATADEVRAIDAHGMLPLVYRWSGNPALRDGALRAAALEALRLENVREVVAALDGRAVLTKGTALAYSIYPAPELRPRNDVDLLIDEHDLEAVRAAFALLGFIENLAPGDE